MLDLCSGANRFRVLHPMVSIFEQPTVGSGLASNCWYSASINLLLKDKLYFPKIGVGKGYMLSRPCVVYVCPLHSTFKELNWSGVTIAFYWLVLTFYKTQYNEFCFSPCV